MQQSRWLLMRGLVRETAQWNGFPERFQTHFPAVDLHCLDLPGNGKRYQETTPLSVSGMVARLQAEFESLKPTQYPNYLFAASLGAMVALQWLLEHPQQFAGAVFINTSIRGLSPFYRRLRPGNYPLILKTLREKDIESRERLVLKMTSNRFDIHPEIAPQLAAAQRQRPVSRLNALRQILAGSRYQFPATQPNIPILILNSIHDRLVDTSCSDNLARFLNVPCYSHPTAGHDLVLDDPLWALERVREWNSEIQNAGKNRGYKKIICL